MIYKILEDNTVLLYLALPDETDDTRQNYLNVLLEYGDVHFDEHDIIHFKSHKRFEAAGGMKESLANEFVREILIKLGKDEYR